MITPKKQLGQHWLNENTILLAIADAAEVRVGDFILEIGPGLGSLTRVLIDKGAKILAVELDESLAGSLKKQIGAGDNLTVISQDILKFDFSQLPTDYKIVANIPYYLSSHLLRLISETKNPPVQASLLLQKEVTERVCAKPGQMSTLSVTTQMYFEATPGMVVRAGLFTPPPKVDSQLLILNKREQPLFGNNDPKVLFRLVKAGFGERRKKLRSSLSSGLYINKTQAEKLLNEARIDSNLRAQNLSLDDWLNLFKSWSATKS